MKKHARLIILIVIIALAVTSYFTRPQPAAGADAPLFAGAPIDPHLLSVFQRSCADCHSERTHYPWYSYVAPVSILISHDVHDGRRHLNLSRWDQLPSVRRQRSLSEIANQVRDGEMPIYYYVWLHPDAALSQADADAIFNWTQTERMRLILENAPPPPSQ